MQKKVLCLGTNSILTDEMCSSMAMDFNSVNYGLVDADLEQIEIGIYHTSVVDLSPGEIIKMAKKFDEIVMLDQPRSEWSHWKILQTTYKVMVDLEKEGINTKFRDNQNTQRLEKIVNLTQHNKSWCIYPWTNFIVKDEAGVLLCARSRTVLTPEFSVNAWANSDIAKDIKSRMLAGERIPEHCEYCYEYEDRGIESYRQYESTDWCNQLDIADLSELPDLSPPKYYEIHWGNKCNLKCRGCVPSRSSAIEIEFAQHNVKMPFHDSLPTKYPAVDVIDIENLDRTSRVYVSGGEPSIMPETLEFMDRCIAAGRTDFELTMSTNGVKFPQKFLDKSRHFKNFNFSFSLDGYREFNDYWRSGAQWDKIVANMKLIQEMGHIVTINTVPGIHNVTNLHLLLEWLDQEFPMTAIYMQINHVGIQSAYNHPNRDAVIESMKKCQQTKIYWSNGKSCRTAIDSILDFYENNHSYSKDDLKEFFKFNDKLDEIRGVKLGDVIPELESCRKLLG